MKRKSKFSIRPLSVSEMAILYRVHRQTFYRWLKPFQKKIGKRNGRYYSIKQVRQIFSYLGVPDLSQLD